MKIGILIGHPTQFEGPFFRYAACHSTVDWAIIYTNTAKMEQVFDPELGTSVSWGIDLLSGYAYQVVPARKRLQWLHTHLKHEQYDLLIVNGYSDYEYLLAALIARAYGTKVALRLDSVLFNNVSIRKRLLKKVLFLGFSRLYDHFFAIGSLTVAYLQYFGITRERISLFTYVVDVEYFRKKSQLEAAFKQRLKARYGIPNQHRVILSVTKFNEREAPWDLLKAFCALQAKELTLLLVGDGQQRKALEQYAHQFPEHHIVLPGYVPYPELPTIYGIADVFVHPVPNEPWGVSVAEAQACGLPVITSSSVGAGYDHIRPGINGYIYPVGDITQLQSYLETLLANYNASEICFENSKVLSKWDHAATLQNILAASEAIENKRHP